MFVRVEIDNSMYRYYHGGHNIELTVYMYKLLSLQLSEWLIDTELFLFYIKFFYIIIHVNAAFALGLQRNKNTV